MGGNGLDWLCYLADNFGYHDFFIFLAYRISLNNVRPPLNSVPFFEKVYYVKKEHYSNICSFEMTSLANVLGHYLRKYGTYL